MQVHWYAMIKQSGNMNPTSRSFLATVGRARSKTFLKSFTVILGGITCAPYPSSASCSSELSHACGCPARRVIENKTSIEIGACLTSRVEEGEEDEEEEEEEEEKEEEEEEDEEEEEEDEEDEEEEEEEEDEEEIQCWSSTRSQCTPCPVSTAQTPATRRAPAPS